MKSIPAYPRPYSKELNYNNDTIHYEHYAQEGMTLRDYFAGQTLNGILIGSDKVDPIDFVGSSEKTNAEILAENAYFMADAMLKEREKNEPPNT